MTHAIGAAGPLVQRAALARNSQLHGLCRRGDFLDCYSVRVEGGDATIEQIAQRIFIGLPRWINLLLAIRDSGVMPFGLKATADLPKDNRFRDTISVGESISFLPVRSMAPDEIILGEDDRHLDFKIAVRRDRGTPDRVFLATWVRPHHLLGRAYLNLILPFHVLIVCSRLAALARHFRQKRAAPER
ncbi:MAG: DUF2867 domain-containing protein [Pseudomonadota bacterium]